MNTLTSRTSPPPPTARSGGAVPVGRVSASIGASIGAVLLVAASFGTPGAVAAALAVGAVAAIVDARTGRLPNPLVALVGAAALAGATVAAVSGSPSQLGAAGAGALLLAGPLLAVHLVTPAAMGFGDVKLGAGLGATVGLLDARSALVALCVATAATAAVGLLRRRHALPLGPGLVAGAAIVLALEWS